MTETTTRPTKEDYAAARRLRGTQEQVAGFLDVDRTTIAKRETGTLPVSREAWLAINALPLPKEKS